MSEAANKQLTTTTRGPGKPFLPGQSGNPNGRPRKGETVTDALRAYASAKWKGKPAKKALAERLWTLAMENDDAVGIAALRYIYDRLDGRPKESVEHSTPLEGFNFVVTYVKPEDVDE